MKNPLSTTLYYVTFNMETETNEKQLIYSRSAESPRLSGTEKRKNRKGDKELTIVDNNGFVLGPLTVKSVNQQDMVILPESLAKLVYTQIGVEIHGSAFTLDTGFDSQKNKDLISEQKLIPVIYPNRRNTKDPIAIAWLFSCFNKKLYNERYKVERT